MAELSYTLTTLKCGLPVLTIPMPAIGSVTALVLTNTGSRYEKPEKEGIAHFFEHIVFKGTKAYPTALDLSSAVDAIGAEFNAFTSKEYTGYYVKSASKHLSKSLDVLSDMLLLPEIRQEDVTKEKGVIIEEINMYRDNPMSHVANLFDVLFFEDRGLKHEIIGSKETVNSVTSHDFEEFLAEWYDLENMVLILAGDSEIVGDKKTLDLAEKMFSKEPKIKRTAGKKNLKPYFSEHIVSSDYLWVEEKKTEQAHLVLGWPGLPRGNPDRYAMSVLSVIMGGNMSSRLFTEVREKRALCYYVRSDVDYFQNTGVVGASAGVDPTRVYEAIEVTLQEFRAIADGSKPVSESELTRAKEYIAGMTVLSLEDSESVAQYFGSKQLLQGEIDTPEEVLKKIQAVTIDQVHQLANRLYKGKPKLAVVGPFADKEKFEELLK
jgi:predicted Zn-dependent peptidase